MQLTLDVTIVQRKRNEGARDFILRVIWGEKALSLVSHLFPPGSFFFPESYDIIQALCCSLQLSRTGVILLNLIKTSSALA